MGATADPEGRRPLHWCAGAGDGAAVHMLLLCKADVFAADASGNTPLHWASARAHVQCVELLLNKCGDTAGMAKALCEARDASGRSAMMVAAADCTDEDAGARRQMVLELPRQASTSGTELEEPVTKHVNEPRTRPAFLCKTLRQTADEEYQRFESEARARLP